jgi:ADP-ribosyl-[dinitrogen reductase] hydrolase
MGDNYLDAHRARPHPLRHTYFYEKTHTFGVSMIGSLAGDLIGSAYEFSRLKNKNFQPLFHPKARFTDDTVCTVAVADALLTQSDPQESMVRWCNTYAENGGWGRQFALWFLSDKPQPYGSWGNGAAMRISPVGFLANDESQVLAWSDRFSGLTHNHPEAMGSAQAVALAIYWARQGDSMDSIKRQLIDRYGYALEQTPDDIRPDYVRTERATDSVPQAISCAIYADGFEDAIRNAVSLGGDSDTIAAIAGGIAEAAFGVPDHIKKNTLAYLPGDMRSVVLNFYERIQTGGKSQSKAHNTANE